MSILVSNIARTLSLENTPLTDCKLMDPKQDKYRNGSPTLMAIKISWENAVRYSKFPALVDSSQSVILTLPQIRPHTKVGEPQQ